ncbi:transcription initiation protein [Actinomadura spongiicola]|uniref:Transcription initiation protein n=1 Tax=Actinomadura spongiicola TaxID=2303421 RepID=A0A372GNR2_9ACTN|nr:YciI family protein [Actinomadura spongiicola]RFS86782.1 transcription initiation protein [Actinomadura spongiicola]
MKYMMLICGDENAELTADELAVLEEDTIDWVEKMDARSVRKLGSRLRPTDTATTIRVRDGETLMSDGPFTETKEQILGFDLIECADLEEALEIASKHPTAQRGSIEVRPLWEE